MTPPESESVSPITSCFALRRDATSELPEATEALRGGCFLDCFWMTRKIVLTIQVCSVLRNRDVSLEAWAYEIILDKQKFCNGSTVEDITRMNQTGLPRVLQILQPRGGALKPKTWMW